MTTRISEVNVGMNDIVTYKCNSAVTDVDVNKPVKLSASDTVDLCADGDGIYGFINSVEVHTLDGKPVVGVQVSGRKWVTLSGNSAVGTIVEAAANEAVSVALATTWGVVSTKAAVAADLAVDASGTLIAASVNALLAAAIAPVKAWKVIYGAGTDTTDALVELQ